MCNLNTCPHLSVVWICIIIIAVVWELVWKCIAMWKTAKNNQLAWFVCIAIFNTVGILPIIYLIKHRKR